MWRFAFVVVGVTLLVCLHEYTTFRQENWADFRSFYFAAVAVREHVDPYDADVLTRLGGDDHVWPYLYSPLLAVLVQPLTGLGLGAAFRTWTLLSIVSFAASAAIATHQTRTSTLRAIVYSTLAALGLGLANVLHFGQVNAIVLLPLTASIVLRERRPHLAGACLALAGLLKSSPFFFLLVFALERRWRAVASCLVTAALLAGLTLFFVNAGEWQAFVDVARRCSRLEPVPGLFGFEAPWNFSISGVLLRSTSHARLLAPLVSGLLALPVLVAAWQQRRGFVLSGLSVMVLSSPLAWTHHVIYVFPGVIAVLLDAAARRRTLYAVVTLVAATAAGVDFPLQNLGWLNCAAMVVLYVLGFLA